MSYPGHTLEGSLTPLLRCSPCILQLQPTEPVPLILKIQFAAVASNNKMIWHFPPKYRVNLDHRCQKWAEHLKSGAVPTFVEIWQQREGDVNIVERHDKIRASQLDVVLSHISDTSFYWGVGAYPSARDTVGTFKTLPADEVTSKLCNLKRGDQTRN